MNIFRKYADYYDLIYQDKNYTGECDFLEKIFKKYSEKKVRTILNLGCGTGNHDIFLAKRGYKVTGIDISKNMLKIAKEKAKKEKLNIDFRLGDVRKINLRKKFDAVVSMFAVASYQISDGDLKSFFKTARIHLKRGGLFVFDFWYGPAVLNLGPKKVVKKFEYDSKTSITREVVPEIDLKKKIVDVKINLIVKKRNKIVEQIKEIHKMRYLFGDKLKGELNKNRFACLKISPFMCMKKRITFSNWNAVIISLCR